LELTSISPLISYEKDEEWEAMNSTFTFYKRHTNKKNVHIYYVRFRDPDTGERLAGLSTGCTSKGAAQNWAMEYLASGRLVRKSNMKFGDFAKDWFIWGKCSYIEMKHAKGHGFTHTHADHCKANLERHILPEFRLTPINKITVDQLEQFLIKLISPTNAGGKSLSPQTANNIFQVLRTMLGEAHRKGLIDMNPATHVSPLAANNRDHGVFTHQEVLSLFSDTAFTQVWGSNINQFVINLIAASTGLRQGEVQALRVGNFKGTYLVVDRTWDRKYGLKSPKYDSTRCVPIPSMTESWIERLIEMTPDHTKDDLLFCSTIPDKPIEHKQINKYFKRAVERIGVSSTEIAERFLSFHSWRHTFNTLMRDKISDSKLRRLTGHKSEEMTESYTHFQIEDFQDVLSVQNTLFLAS